MVFNQVPIRGNKTTKSFDQKLKQVQEICGLLAQDRRRNITPDVDIVANGSWQFPGLINFTLRQLQVCEMVIDEKDETLFKNNEN